MGNGFSGPESGPETGGRGLEDGISFFFFPSPGCSEVVVEGERWGVCVNDYYLKWRVSIRK